MYMRCLTVGGKNRNKPPNRDTLLTGNTRAAIFDQCTKYRKAVHEMQ